jgi:hypothetical protein
VIAMMKNNAQTHLSNSHPLKITMVGGHMRSLRRLAERCRMEGWKLEMHSGQICGRGVEELRTQIGRSDIVAITTRVNSHASMFLAKNLSRQFGRALVIVRRENFDELKAAIHRYLADACVDAIAYPPKQRRIPAHESPIGSPAGFNLKSTIEIPKCQTRHYRNF